VHVPYKGNCAGSQRHHREPCRFHFHGARFGDQTASADKARILAVATDKRIPSLPDIPTLAEAGVKDFESGTWNAMACATEDTGRDSCQAQQSRKRGAAKPRSAGATLPRSTCAPPAGSPAEAAAFIKKETEVWGGVIKDANVEAH
jgi:tripartite-type tricarboxylate transporter receptor subunit TctC